MTPIERVREALDQIFDMHQTDGKASDTTGRLALIVKRELEGMMIVPVSLPDKAYEEAVEKTRKSLELGMTFGDDPIEQIVHIVHQAMIAQYRG